MNKMIVVALTASVALTVVPAFAGINIGGYAFYWGGCLSPTKDGAFPIYDAPVTLYKATGEGAWV